MPVGCPPHGPLVSSLPQRERSPDTECLGRVCSDYTDFVSLSTNLVDVEVRARLAGAHRYWILKDPMKPLLEF
jgi:hypothetical protein